ncbi:MAG: peptide-methionine (S)-S-oxide reductase MsrA [Rhodospirillaceae bacterium]
MSPRHVALATFGAGCFWQPQQIFDQVEGVLGTWVGYTGGTKKNPTYEEVCHTNTGHAEVVHMEFDPTVVTYETLLDIFWQIHDPTQLNRQGHDVGTQYRSAIFTHDEYQARVARESQAEKEASGKFPAPIVTTIEPAPTFWEAEDYHQKYMERLDARSWISGLFGKK